MNSNMFSKSLRRTTLFTKRLTLININSCTQITLQNATHRYKSSQPAEEIVTFPSSSAEGKEIPILLNSKEHAVGYLSKILNARVYEAAIETKLQEAKNLSLVRSTIRNILYALTIYFMFIH